MHHSMAMREIECFANRFGDVGGRLPGKPAATVEEALEGLALDELHGKIGLAGVHGAAINPRDVRVHELLQCFDVGGERIAAHRAVHQVARQELDRHRLVALQMKSAQHVAVGLAAERLFERNRPNARVLHEWSMKEWSPEPHSNPPRDASEWLGRGGQPSTFGGSADILDRA
jgi:hypothetical protein